MLPINQRVRLWLGAEPYQTWHCGVLTGVSGLGISFRHDDGRDCFYPMHRVHTIETLPQDPPAPEPGAWVEPN